MSNSHNWTCRSNLESRLSQILDRQQKKTLGWEIAEHVRVNWDAGALSFIETVLSSTGFSGVYGFGAEYDELDLVHCPYAREILEIWLEHRHHPEAPKLTGDNLGDRLYWFAFKVVARRLAIEADAPLP